MTHLIPLALATAALSIGGAVSAAAPREFLSRFENAARSTDPSFVPTAARGAAFFTAKHATAWSCSSCHTPDPKAQGTHAATGKLIQPLAPAAQPDRLTDPAKVDKWFRRNCSDVLNRECTPREKADVVAWLLSIR